MTFEWKKRERFWEKHLINSKQNFTIEKLDINHSKKNSIVSRLLIYTMSNRNIRSRGFVASQRKLINMTLNY